VEIQPRFKKAGAYQYRIAIRDEQGGAVGSASQFIQVPNLKKSQLTLSSMVLETLTVDQWNKISDPGANQDSSSLRDTALRQAKRGTVLRYGLEIYNARPSPAGKPDLTAKMRLISDGKIVFDGKPQPVPIRPSDTEKRVALTGAISMGTQLPAGDYLLQVIVTDNAAPEKKKLASQYVQFELVQ
jgi:hypothetical protein